MNAMTRPPLLISPAKPARHRVLVLITVALLTAATTLGACSGGNPPPASAGSTAGVSTTSTNSTDGGPSASSDSAPGATERYSYFEGLPAFDPLTPLEPNEMRITFMGSHDPSAGTPGPGRDERLYRWGWRDNPKDPYYHGRPVDQMMFDMGAGTSANYAAAKVGYRRMDKLFINHLHADHMNDLLHTYCFGPAGDRKSPMYVWGSKASGVESPAGSGVYYDDGVIDFCSHLREAARWHTESFSFQRQPPPTTCRPPRRAGVCLTIRYRSATMIRATPTPSCPSSSIGRKSVEWPTRMPKRA